MYMDDKKIKAKFKYADRLKIPYVAILGENEVKNNTVSLKNMVTGEVTKTDLPKSNVLYYELENDAWCCVRPSGTEPKIKFYLGVKEESMEKAEEAINLLGEEMFQYSK